MNRLASFALVFSVLFLVISCGDDDLPQNPIDPSSMEWFFQENVGANFIMHDDNGIANEFILEESIGANSQNGYQTNGLDADLSKINYYYQDFSDTYFSGLKLGVRSSYGSYGDTFTISINEVDFAIDLNEALVTSVHFESTYLAYSETDEGYENNEEPIYSTVTFLENALIDGVNYDEVMHIQYNDFIASNTDYTIKEIYLAKQFGLIQYVYNNGVVCHRN